MEGVPGLLIAAAVLAVTALAGVLWQRRSGRLRATVPVAAPASRRGPLDAAAAGPAPLRAGRRRAAPAGPPRLPDGLVPASEAAVTLLQFSTASCAPCRQVRAVCADVAGDLAGVRHVELDAQAHLDAVRELSIWRLPTLLVVDRAGQVARRTVGVPDRAALRAAVREVQEAMA